MNLPVVGVKSVNYYVNKPLRSVVMAFIFANESKLGLDWSGGVLCVHSSKNGTVVDPSQNLWEAMDVLIEKGTIKAIEKNIQPEKRIG